jgi:hypothetical protein
MHSPLHTLLMLPFIVSSIRSRFLKKPKKKTQKGGRPRKYIKHNLPKHYVSGLSLKDKKKQIRSIRKSKKDYKNKRYVTRSKLKSYRNKKSNWTSQFRKLYPDAKTISDISKQTKIPKKALLAVKKKGMGAYYSSGSRPNQTAESWGLARMYSYILGGPTRKIDDEITQKYKVKFIHK